MKVYVGVDISKSKFDAAIPTAGGWEFREFRNTKSHFASFVKWIFSQLNDCTPCVVLEATSNYGYPLASFVSGLKISVSVVNPCSVSNFRKSRLKRAKTDRIDSQIISEYGSAMNPPEWKPLPASSIVLRELVGTRDMLVKQRVQLKLRYKAMLSSASKAVLKLEIARLNRSIAEVDSALDVHVASNKDLRGAAALLVTIPGVGRITAYAILAYCPRIREFDSAKQVATFAGIVPKVHESGKFRAPRSMSKIGSAELRRAIYLAALSAARHNPRVKPLFDRIANQGAPGSRKRALGAVMRKLMHIVYGVLKTQTPFKPEQRTTHPPIQ